MSISTTYQANGKLLLSGEYLVLHGAKAIALPLNIGQQLHVSEGHASDSIVWQALYDGTIWFSCELNPKDFSIIRTSHPGKAETLQQIFQAVKSLNSAFQPREGIYFETVLEANPDWGFGSSSTLISLLSQWAKVDPFVLNQLVFGGSGFDIACARATGPIFYMADNHTQDISLDYPFAEQLFLLYSGKKKRTQQEVSRYLKSGKPTVQLIREVSALSDELALCRDQREFNRLVRIHEQWIGKLIGKTPVKEDLFAGFEGEIKSLGAWGGDFYLISSSRSFTEIRKYFEIKGLNTLFRWNELILKRQPA